MRTQLAGYPAPRKNDAVEYIVIDQEVVLPIIDVEEIGGDKPITLRNVVPFPGHRIPKNPNEVNEVREA